MITNDGHSLQHHTTLSNITQFQTEEASYPLDTAYAYTESISTLREVFRIGENAQWIAGDMINQIRDDFLDKSMEDIADDAGVSLSTAYEYASMSRFYPVDMREDSLRLELFYSHMKLAKQLGTLDKAQEFLEVCALNHWSVRVAAMELAKLMGDTPEPPPIHSIPVTLSHDGTRWIIDGLDDLDTSVLYNATLRIAR